MTGPALLPPNGVPRFYRGGPAIAELRGAPAAGDRVPEDWVGSTTEAFGEPGVGLSDLPDGRLLRDAIAAEPLAWLGQAHVDRRGVDPTLLVKLLDAGERLPVHVHPDGPFARTRLGTRFGKTEAWIVVGGTGEVHLGWREDVTDAQLRAWVDGQDVDALLSALHRVEVSAGDAVFVPAGVPHAIGAGLLIVELQEPSDMSVMLEWRGHGIDGEREATLGLGWDVALECTERAARDPRPLTGLRHGSRPLADAAAAFFEVEWLDGCSGTPAVLDAGFSIVLILGGAGRLETADGTTVFLRQGDNVVIPFSSGACLLTGDVRGLRCRPPRADASDGVGR